MDTQKNDRPEEQEDKDFPGYPHYPAYEDIAQPGNNSGIVSLDAETKPRNNEPENEDIVMGTEADVTPEDLNMLSGIDDGHIANSTRDLLDNTDEEGELLSEDNTTAGLDVPGSEDDDDAEDIGAEDEENNYYSLGSSDNDDLENSA